MNNITDPYELNKSQFNIKFPLLTDDQRLSLFDIDDKLAEFENIIKQSVINYRDCFSNGIIISGAPGTGKTYNIKKWLNELIEVGKLDGYDEFSGKISPVTLFQVMRSVGTCTENKILLLDDVDLFDRVDSLNILKAALNTSSDDKTGCRRVSYGTKGKVNSFDFDSFVIMITNQTFTNLTGDISQHIGAVLDRVNLFSITLTPHDMLTKNLSIVENFLNSQNNMRDEVKKSLIEVFDSDIREFIEYDCFSKCRINLSIRFFLKLADLIMMFKDSWKNFSTDYKRLKLELDKQKYLNIREE